MREIMNSPKGNVQLIWFGINIHGLLRYLCGIYLDIHVYGNIIYVARRRSVGRSVGRSVSRSVRPSTPVTRQPIFGSFSKLVGIFLGWIWLELVFVFVKFWILNLKKINFNLKKFKSLFSQNLPNRIFSILAYSFLRMVFKDCKEVYTLKSLQISGGGGGGGVKLSHLTPC